LYGECRAGAQIIFPKSGRGLVHVAHTISIDFFSDSGQNNAMLTLIVVRYMQSLLTPNMLMWLHGVSWAHSVLF